MRHEQGEQVIAWLEAGDAADYQTGVLLLQVYSGNRGLVSLLLKKESANNREKLRYELVKIGCEGRMDDVNEVLNHFAQVAPVALVLATMPLAADVLAGAVPEAAAAEVDELTQLMQRLFNERAQLSNTLADLSEAEGPRVVGQILDLQKQYNALAEKRRRLAAGEPVAEAAPPAPEPAAGAPGIDRAELAKQKQNLRSNISKAKANQGKAKTEAKQAEYAQKVAQLGVELAAVEMQLALPRA